MAFCAPNLWRGRAHHGHYALVTNNVAGSVEALIQQYADRYSAHDVEGVVALCLDPFLAIREGAAIHMADRDAVRDHFAAIMTAYRGSGAARWSPVGIDARNLGDKSCFATVHWNAHDESGSLLRDTYTTYHMLVGPDGWRFLSYTNHF